MIQGLQDWLYLFNSGQDFQSYNRFGAHEVSHGRFSSGRHMPNRLKLSAILTIGAAVR